MLKPTLPKKSKGEVRMKNTRLTRILAMALFALALPITMTAQKHHQYKVVDVGTLGGPNSYHSTLVQILNNRGAFAAYANTSTPNPNPGCFIPFPNFGNPPDCFVEQAVVLRNGAVTELPVLPGGMNSQTNWISGSGLIAGFSENGVIDLLTGLPEARAVLWTKDGQVNDLGTLPGGNESLAGAVNSRGQVVGFSNNDVPDPFSLIGLVTQSRAFLWQNGVMQDLGTLGGTDGVAFDINERGQIAGFSYTNSDATLNPFFWQNGTMTDIGSLGGTFGSPNWLNSRGQVVGFSNLAGDATHHGFLWDQGTLTDVGTLGGDNSEADWISDSGLVVGAADVPGSLTHHGFLWRHGVMTDLGVIDGDACSTGNAVNSRGQVVGNAGVCFVGGRPWLWENGGPMVDLNDLALPGSGLHLQAATEINERGEIVCRGVLPNGDQHVVLLVPVDGVENANSGAVATPSLSPRYVSSGTQHPPQSRWSNRYQMPGLQSPSR
jgi:probable HAF family extracellular repeat protein